MNFEDEFDKIIRQKAEQADFPYDEGNWEKLAGLRAAEKSAAPAHLTWKKYLLPAALLLLGSSAFLSWYFYPVPPASAIVMNESISEVHTAALLPPMTDAHAVEKNTKAETNQPAVNTARGLRANSPEKSRHQIKNNQLISLSGPPVNSDAVEPGSPAASINSIASHLAENSNILLSPGNDQPISVNSVLPAKAMTEQVSQHNEGSNIEAQHVTLTNTEERTGTMPAYLFLPPRQAFLQRQGTEQEATLRIFPLPASKNDYVASRSKFLLSAYAGVHYGLGWSGKTSGSKDGAGTNYFAGMDVHYDVTRKIKLSGGLQYYNFSNIVNPYFVAEKKEYGFGYTQAFTSVTTDHLMYLAVPVKVGYRLTDLFEAGFGINTAYLVAAHTRIDTYGVSDGVKGAVISSGSQKIFEGTRSLNVMGTAYLNIHLTNRFSGFAELQYGLTDLFQNYTKSDKRQNSSGLRIGLNYYIGKK